MPMALCWPSAVVIRAGPRRLEGGGYWGDYQGTKYAFLNGLTPKFLTTFTDSSAGCDKYWEYDSHNVHVSAVTF